MDNPPAISRTPRFTEIDLLRTMGVVLMIIYHLGYDLSLFFNAPIDPLSGGWKTLQLITANLFLVLVGVSFAVSHDRMMKAGASRFTIFKKYLRQGCIVLACGMLVTIATALTVGEEFVRFGVLHLIGVSIILLPLFIPLKEWNILTAALIMIIGWWMPFAPIHTSLLLPLGFTPVSFTSIDFFPLIPWFATILIGAAVGNALYNRGLLRWHLPETKWWKLLASPGRYSLQIYLIHQPMLLAILYGTTWIGLL
ncbi:MAG: heparan-alpha-glucosaminide N-acetyltransferase [Candidatus Peribacteraceae bacterium]|nr:heparan-alpha-glucosaminide N-acetyltransferase [Candidatus Peribacteraceae bacterium]